MIKNLPANLGDMGSIPGLEDPLVEEMATHYSILAWRIPWREEPGRLSMGSQRVGHDWATEHTDFLTCKTGSCYSLLKSFICFLDHSKKKKLRHFGLAQQIVNDVSFVHTLVSFPSTYPYLLFTPAIPIYRLFLECLMPHSLLEMLTLILLYLRQSRI